MSFANPWGLALLGLAVPVILTHILRPRRTAATVSSTLLWRSLERPVAAASPWQRLRWSWLLLAQLLAVVGLALGVARPQRVEPAPFAEHTVFVIDASGSMAATDVGPDRLAAAAQRAVELRDELPDGGRASIVVAGTRPRVLLTASTERDEFARALRLVDQSQGTPDFADAFALAASLDTGATTTGYVLLTDGGIGEAEQRLIPGGTRVETIGTADDNRAITRLVVDQRNGRLHARVVVANTGGPAVTQHVRLDVDGVTADTRAVEIAAGTSTDVEFDVPLGDIVAARLTGGDLLSGDDHAVAVVRQSQPQRVLLAGDGLFWNELLTALPGVTVEHSDAARSARGYDLAIYSGVAVPADPGAPFIAIAPPGGVRSGATGLAATVDNEIVLAGTTVERPAVTLVRTDDPLLGGIDLSGIEIAGAQRIASTSAEVLVAGENAPLLLRGRLDGQRYAYFTFDMRESNLGVQLAFPLLAERLIGQLTGTTAISEPLIVGARLPIPVGGTDDVTITGPDGQPTVLPAGATAPIAERAGIYRIESGERPALEVAVNAAPGESRIAPTGVTVPTTGGATDGGDRGERTTSYLHWVLWPLLAIVAIEAVLAWQRRGVGRRQWWLAAGARVIVAALVVAALLDPQVNRPARDVATLFVVDGSASIGVGGTGRARGLVDAVLAERTGEDRAGVVVFGADARVDRVVGQLDRLDQARAIVDPTATDIAGGLRLGRALAPTDARSRLVLVSDGRANLGDLGDQLDELVSAGVPVDVLVLDSGDAADVAVSALGIPTVVRPSDAVPITVDVTATAAGPATVVLRRDGVEVDRQSVELETGTNTVRFTDTPGEDAGAIVRYEASVRAPSNAVAENDVGFGAAAVDGPAKVLIVEGRGGEATTLAAALRAGGVGSDVIRPAALPGVQQLSTYAGIVLVDVDARELSGEQVADLTTVVRQMGRGLLTIGGRQSYGVGGYLDSPLNDLLPVDSEIVDPLRRRTVAEVLSIDTSESMGACHCAGGNMGPTQGGSDQGGINKTDISRAAAERTISALSGNDQIGVLAWNSTADWVIPLQALPPAEVVDQGLRSLRPAGNTNMTDSLSIAAEALLASDAELKHIILFTDGFTSEAAIDRVADEAAELFAEHGITTSVLATGEGAAPLLQAVAEAGNGRFYFGADLNDVPQIMAEEAVIASRDFITEGNFVPEVTGRGPLVDDLDATPALLGYVATTAKGQATTLLRIGPDRDPLLSTWQAGLGTVSSWTSDANDWTALWSGWDGYVDFMTTMVKDTLAAGDDAGAVQGRLADGRLTIMVESTEAFPEGAAATATVTGPDGQTMAVGLERVDDARFRAVVDAPRAGTYAVSAVVSDRAGEQLLASSNLVSNSYPAEFVPGSSDRATLERIALTTGGRLDPGPAAVWDRAGLADASRPVEILGWLLLAAALLWPLAVVLSRLSLRGASLAGATAATGARLRALATPRRDAENLPGVRRPRPPSPDAPPLSSPESSAAPSASTPESSPAASPKPTDAARPATSRPQPTPTRSPTAAAAPPKSPAAPSTDTVGGLLAGKRRRQDGS